nr:type II toxin-antitoxin system VapC family toxin [Rhodocyclus purpureus]
MLDTCVLSELVKVAPSSEVLAWVAAREDGDLFVAAMTLAELRRGVAKLPSSRRKNELSTWVENLARSFGDRVLPFTGETAAYWAEMCARAEAAGKPMAAFDSIIAATAVEHGLALVTRNQKDFVAAPVMVIDPWG